MSHFTCLKVIGPGLFNFGSVLCLDGRFEQGKMHFEISRRNVRHEPRNLFNVKYYFTRQTGGDQVVGENQIVEEFEAGVVEYDICKEVQIQRESCMLFINLENRKSSPITLFSPRLRTS